MMDDLVKRLRNSAQWHHSDCALKMECADRIEADAKRIAALEAELASGSFYKETDIDALMSRAKVERDLAFIEEEAIRFAKGRGGPVAAKLRAVASNYAAIFAALEARDARIAELALDALAAHTQADEAYQAQLTAEARVKVLEKELEWLACQPETPAFMVHRARAALEGEK